MEEVQGHSLRTFNTTHRDRLSHGQGTSVTDSEKRKRSWHWHKTNLKNGGRVNSEAAIAEEGQLPGKAGDVKPRTVSISDSSTGSVQRPSTVKNADSAAVDRLYQLDFDDAEFDRSEAAGRGYDG